MGKTKGKVGKIVGNSKRRKKRTQKNSYRIYEIQKRKKGLSLAVRFVFVWWNSSLLAHRFVPSSLPRKR